jgi:hypothetical protein
MIESSSTGSVQAPRAGRRPAQNSPLIPHAIFSGHQGGFLSRLSFALNGNLLVSYAHDASTRFWDVPLGVERFAPARNTVLIGRRKPAGSRWRGAKLSKPVCGV